QSSFSADFDFVLSSIPKEIILTDFSRDEISMSIKGKADNAKVIKSFFDKLSQNKKYKVVIINDVVGSPSQGYDFSISIAETIKNKK
ncbi:MAG: PilN domain-containing protein, partial [Candidatus Roizmanbacteria bacterium]